MGKNLFSVTIFFVVFRETIEAAIIISVLLSFVEQLMTSGRLTSPRPAEDKDGVTTVQTVETDDADIGGADKLKRIIRRMRIQIWAGTFVGFFVSLCIGAAFIAVFYTTLSDLWAKSEQIWEGVFSLLASIIIFFMGLAFLKMDRSRVKWRIKLSQAFDDSIQTATGNSEEDALAKRRARSGKWALFLLPFITLIREGLEAVVFVGGVSLGQPATSIPIPVITGILAGAVIGYIIYRSGSTIALSWFLIASTYLLFLIGAGLFSKCIGFFEYYRFAKAVGGDVAETGNGPGSYQVAGNVWHLTYGNPETGAVGTNGGWQIFNAIFGWNNNASIGTILGYCLYWIAIMVSLIYIKWSEGRVTFFGHGSKAYHRMEARRIERAHNADLKVSPAPPSIDAHRSDSDHSSEDGKRAMSEEQELPTSVVLGRGARLDSDSSDNGDSKA
ncbi:high-affinity iron permease [Naganishia albida]|nr:high-affinity iron permease [Naganishia albida]